MGGRGSGRKRLSVLTPYQRVAGHMLLDGAKLSDIAKVIKVEYQTVWSWRKRPEFREFIAQEAEMRDTHIRNEHLTRVRKILNLSMDVIEKNLSGEEANSKFILELASKIFLDGPIKSYAVEPAAGGRADINVLMEHAEAIQEQEWDDRKKEEENVLDELDTKNAVDAEHEEEGYNQIEDKTGGDDEDNESDLDEEYPLADDADDGDDDDDSDDGDEDEDEDDGTSEKDEEK